MQNAGFGNLRAHLCKPSSSTIPCSSPVISTSLLKITSFSLTLIIFTVNSVSVRIPTLILLTRTLPIPRGISTSSSPRASLSRPFPTAVVGSGATSGSGRLP